VWFCFYGARARPSRHPEPDRKTFVEIISGPVPRFHAVPGLLTVTDIRPCGSVGPCVSDCATARRRGQARRWGLKPSKNAGTNRCGLVFVFSPTPSRLPPTPSPSPASRVATRLQYPAHNRTAPAFSLSRHLSPLPRHLPWAAASPLSAFASPPLSRAVPDEVRFRTAASRSHALDHQLFPPLLRIVMWGFALHGEVLLLAQGCWEGEDRGCGRPARRALGASWRWGGWRPGLPISPRGRRHGIPPGIHIHFSPTFILPLYCMRW
jgi:hypothetical protein